MVVSGRGLGASGGVKYCVVSIVGAVSPQHVEKSDYYSKYFEDGKKPLTNWLTLEIFGVVAGGFLSGALSGRLKLKVEKSPKITVTRRLIFAFLGGSAVCLRRTACQGMYQRSRTVRHGGTLSGRVRDNDHHFRLSLSLCMVFQEELDIRV